MLHHQTRKAIIAKYYPLPLNKSKEDIEKEIFDQLVADGKEFEDAEIQDIVNEIFENGTDKSDKNLGAGADEQQDVKKSINRNYEEWRVEAKKEDILDNAGKRIGSKVVEWEKLKKLRITSISPDKAELLNSQSENTNLRLFEVEA